MKIRELIDLVTKAAGDADQEKTIVKFAQPVECSDCESEMTVEVGLGFDRYHDDTLHDVEVPVYFDIEEWTAMHNIVDVVDSSAHAVIVMDRTWNKSTKSMSLTKFLQKLRSMDDCKDVAWSAADLGVGGMRMSDSAWFDFVGNPKTGRRYPFFGNSRGTVKFDSAVVISTDDVDENPNNDTIEEYVEEHKDELYDQALEHVSEYDGSDDNWLGGDGPDD